MKKERIHKYYTHIAVEDLLIIYNYKNIMELGKFDKILLSTTSKKFLLEKKNIIDTFGGCLLLSGQKGILKEARRSIAGFKLRKGSVIGCVTTLRSKAMYTFIDRMITFGCPFGVQLDRKGIPGPQRALRKQGYAGGGLNINKTSDKAVVAKTNVQNLEPSDTELLLQFKNLLSEGRVEFEKASTQNLYRGFGCTAGVGEANPRNLKKRVVDRKMQKKHVIFSLPGRVIRKEEKNLSMGIKSFSVAKNFPEYDFFFSLFESIKGFHTVWSFSFPRITNCMRIYRPYNKSYLLYRQAQPLVGYQPPVEIQQTSFLFQALEAWVGSTVASPSVMHQPESQFYFFFVPKQKKNIFFTQFQCPINMFTY